ncbi:MAG TPA: hypothetical protein VFX03_11195, partial [Thermomicrobiales bacterium]|nr:hypothetical protein [Thermomicrobiales bacterium]
ADAAPRSTPSRPRSDRLPPAAAPQPSRTGSRPDRDADRAGFDDVFDQTPPSAAFGRRASRAAQGRPDAEDPLNASAWDLTDDDWDANPIEIEPEDEPIQPRPARRTRTTRSARPARRASAPAAPRMQVPAFLAQADLTSDRIALGLLGLNVLSVILMAIVLGSGIGSLPSTIVLYLDAAGLPDRWGPPRVLWRIPLLAAMITLINLVIAWFLSPLDRFASRFLLATAFVVQLLAWVAVFQFR